MRFRKSLIAVLAATSLSGMAAPALASSANTTDYRYIGCGSGAFFSGKGGYAYNRAAMTYGLTSGTVTDAASTLNSFTCSSRAASALYTRKTDKMTFTGTTVTGISAGTGGGEIAGGVTSRNISWKRSARTANLTNYYSNIKASGYLVKFTFSTAAEWSTKSSYSDAIATSVSDSDYL